MRRDGGGPTSWPRMIRLVGSGSWPPPGMIMPGGSWPADRAFTGGGVADRARLGEVNEVIRPLADAGDEVAELWLARWLADCNRLGELRQRAGRGGYHASRLLARRLAAHDMAGELRDRAAAGDSHALRALARWLAEQDRGEELRDLVAAAGAGTRLLIFDATGERGSAGMNALRVLAGLGDNTSRLRLARRLARDGQLDELRRRADGGDEYARHWLDEAPAQP
jgi:hypothetical protein